MKLDRKKRGYFEGWYLKQQNKNETVALIPAFHRNRQGEASASLQVITDSRAYQFDFPAEEFSVDSETKKLSLGQCTFSEKMCRLNAESADCRLHGVLRFGPLTEPRYPIMGPFSLLPFMQCRHTVFSVFHRVDGRIRINQQVLFFKNSPGYVEGDRGVSFPRRYIWSQCSWNGGSLMLSVADVPYAGFHFTGCIGFLYLNGEEYRIGTYLGAKMLHVSRNLVMVRQGQLTLTVRLLHENSQPLRAPEQGGMTRSIHESVSAVVQYKCTRDRKVLFDFISSRAGFESDWGDSDESSV